MNFITISRPRFWLYLAGPCLIGITVAFLDSGKMFTGWQRLVGVLLMAYFLFPANLFLYGVNDLADEDTDQHNDKKNSYEHRLKIQEKNNLIRGIIFWNVPFVLTVIFRQEIIPNPSVILSLSKNDMWLIGFIFLSLLYSLPPMRFKAIPFIDGISNVLYILPGYISYTLLGGQNFVWEFFVAGWLRCIAMHAFSAIPDIQADSKAGITTTAVLLGKKYTLRYCRILYLTAGFLAAMYGGIFFILIGIMYASYIVLGLFSNKIFDLYTWFPVINTVVGFLLFIKIISR